MPQAKAVHNLFTSIASRYDRMNHILSGGVDCYWRRKLIQSVAETAPKTVLDLATGSGDVALALKIKLGPSSHIVGLDFCQAMLDEAERKKQKKGLSLDLICGDCHHLPFENNSFDAATLAFGLRNFENRRAALEEIRRVLKHPGGILWVLEFSQPQAWLRPFYYRYLKFFLPLIAHLGTGCKGAYDYLATSIEHFPTKESLQNEILGAGFSNVSALGLTGSLVAIHRCAV